MHGARIHGALAVLQAHSRGACDGVSVEGLTIHVDNTSPDVVALDFRGSLLGVLRDVVVKAEGEVGGTGIIVREGVMGPSRLENITVEV